MAHKKRHRAPVPDANRPKRGPAEEAVGPEGPQAKGEVTSFQEQDPKRRIGDYEGTGQHSYQQPGGLNDADH